ncbi:MAG: hypothetical protein RIR49_1618 [Actinomycetota bacterium]|jgi:hypothetical protein
MSSASGDGHDGTAPTPAVGALTTGWRLALLVAWGAVIVGLAAVWAASRQIGLSTWWLAPGMDGVASVVRLTPFITPMTMVVLILLRQPRLWLVGLVAGTLTMVIGLGDLGRVDGLAVVEILLGASGAAASAAAWTGTYRDGRR